MRSLNPDRWFAAAFKTEDAKTPYHNNTCDACHVRNGSGIPINTDHMLDKVLGDFMVTDQNTTPMLSPGRTTPSPGRSGP